MENIDIIKIEKHLMDNIKPINFYVDMKNIKYKNFSKNENMGIYVFWYNNELNKIKELYRDLIIEGPNGSKENIQWDWNMDNKYLCLYVGKTRDFQKRISQHLLLKTENLKNIDGNKLNKKTTACQLRSGFDYLYSKNNDVNIKNELQKTIFLSLYYENDFIKRFYIEDYLIGKLKPWFNVDSER
ncbi:hypothetical protein AGMMS50293_31270 [Spirochaetia bacterium]|nr:hypothetical protein AGMMS50293_31270 [Spirochaetia bacterium]